VKANPPSPAKIVAGPANTIASTISSMVTMQREIFIAQPCGISCNPIKVSDIPAIIARMKYTLKNPLLDTPNASGSSGSGVS
jgi:hypothetical protein